jgi:hypothetical protein
MIERSPFVRFDYNHKQCFNRWASSVARATVSQPRQPSRSAPGGTTTCTLASTNPTAVTGSTPQISVSENPGEYCVEIYDVGNLTGNANFSVTIAHS